jgi:hypothetical protein
LLQWRKDRRRKGIMAEEVKDAVIEGPKAEAKTTETTRTVEVDKRDRDRIDALRKAAAFKAKQASQRILEDAHQQINFLLSWYGGEGEVIQGYDLKSGMVTIEKAKDGITA